MEEDGCKWRWGGKAGWGAKHSASGTHHTILSFSILLSSQSFTPSGGGGGGGVGLHHSLQTLNYPQLDYRQAPTAHAPMCPNTARNIKVH